jgi:hypothetical protein
MITLGYGVFGAKGHSICGRPPVMEVFLSGAAQPLPTLRSQPDSRYQLMMKTSGVIPTCRSKFIPRVRQRSLIPELGGLTEAKSGGTPFELDLSIAIF